jgi:N-acetylneuraminic acid mutarotase/photosystem II stability/assembly factor-like uncharacterized protein
MAASRKTIVINATDKDSELTMKTEKLILMALTLVSMFMIIALISVDAQASFGWNAAGSLTTARRSHSATLLQNGKVLVVGGEGSLANPVASAELHDPVTNSWSAAASLTTARTQHSATMLPSGKVLVVGGTGNGSAIASAELYDPVTNSWSPAGSLVVARSRHSATLLQSGKVLVTGGYNGSASLASAELYDPATNSWSIVGSLATARVNHTVILMPSGKVLVAGGHDGSSYLASVEVYDPATNNWTAAAPLATARERHSATVLPNGKVLVAGGYDGSSYLASAELYDPAMNSWSAAGALAAARKDHSGTLLANGKVLVAGGIGNASELYDPATNSWSVAGTMATVRINHSATLLPNGKVLVVGGYDGINRFASVELYDPVTPLSWSAAGSLATPRFYHSATLLPNGKVLVVGGDSDSSTASAELYDPVTNSWSAAASMANPRQSHSATLLSNGKVLVAGGYIGVGLSANSELYDPATNSWSSTGSMVITRYLHSATLLPNGKVLVTGGANNNGNGAIAIAELYDPATNSWSAAGSLSAARIWHRATLLANGKVLVTGGAKDVDGASFSSTELYNPATNSWSAAGSLLTARRSHSSTLLTNGKVLVVGGEDGIFSSPEQYDPATNSWSAAGSLNTARIWHRATLLANGKVLVTGGMGNSFIANAEQYDPAMNSWSAAASMATGRFDHSATLLPNGKVLVTGGWGDGASAHLASAELYDPGVGFSDSRRPVISGLANANDKLSVDGTGFRGDSEASSGATNSSPANYPLLQLRRLDNEQTSFIASDSSLNWNNASFTSQSLNSLLAGYYSATIYVNGIPSLSRMLAIGPSLGVDPAFYDFGFVDENMSSSQIFTISNSGNQNLLVSSIAIVDGDSTVFAIDPGDGANGTCGSLTPTIAAGGNCTISVTFTPVSTGARSTTLRVISYNPTASSTDVALTGTGPLPIFNITAGCWGGEISCHSPVIQGGSSGCIISPPPGYHLATFTDNGENRWPLDGVYTIDDVQADHVIECTFSSGTPWPSAKNITTFAIDPANSQTIYAGTYDNGGGLLKSTDGGATWTAFNESFNAADRIISLVIDPANTQTIYAGTDDPNGVLKSTDGGISWTSVTPYNFSVLSLAIDPNNTQTVYAGADGSIYKTTTGGAAWTHIFSGNNRKGLAIDPTNSQTIYVGGYGSIFKTIDGGATWTTLNIVPPYLGANSVVGSVIITIDSPPPDIISLAIDPTNTQTVYAGTSAGVYKTTDGGTSWVAVNSGLTDWHVQSLAIDHSHTIYAGTSGGLFKTTNGGATWKVVNAGLMNTNVQSLAIDPINGQTLYVGTLSGGVFKVANSPCTPDPPIIGSATTSNGQVTVSFTPPADNGGSNITGYTVTSNPGNKTAIGAASPISISGLDLGTSYTFTVVATNAVGSSAASEASNAVTPYTVPMAPSIGLAIAGNGQASVSFNAPPHDGGSAITGYTVTSSPGNITATGTASPITVTGLTNGTAYTFTVVATNAAGNSAASSATYNPVIPLTVPGAPTIDSIVAGYRQATVSFTPSADNGGSLITGYMVTANPGNINFTGTASPITVTNLMNGIFYTFTVIATNAAGNSVASAPSSSIKPLAVYTVLPGSVANVTITPATVQTVGEGMSTTFSIVPDDGYGAVVSGCGGRLTGTTYTTGPINNHCLLVVEAVKRSGSTSGTTPSVVDAINVFRAANKVTTLTPQQLVRYDVAPLGASGAPAGNGVLDLADVILILRRSIGIGSW